MSRQEIDLERLASSPLTRRRLLGSAGGLAALATLSALPGDLAWARSAQLEGDPFTLGIASGDPYPHGAVLWTRLAPRPLDPDGGMPAERVRVTWEVATDEDMRRVVRRGSVATTPALAHSVHVEVGGLRPGREYFYRFRVGDAQSPVGRTLTSPPRGAELEGLRFAFASCQEWEDGFYAAYRQMLDEELDVVVHLGDYIYENAIPADGGNRRLSTPLPAIFGHETQTLEDYRARHALYKTDADLQAAHARFPWVVTWDDHEVDNDYADERPSGAPRAPSSSRAARRPTRPSTSTCRSPGTPCPATPTCACTDASTSATSPVSTCSTLGSTATTSPAATASSRPARGSRRRRSPAPGRRPGCAGGSRARAPGGTSSPSRS